jgi:ATP-dependent Clp protease ATP-binding subunit ClpA
MGHSEVQVEHLLLGLFSEQQDDVVARLLADVGLTIEPVRDLVHERVGARPGPCSEEHPPFSPLAKDVLRSAYRFGMGEAGTEHILIVLVASGENGPCEILRLLGTDPSRLRFEAKKRAFPRDAQSTGHQATAIGRPVLPELDFGD